MAPANGLSGDLAWWQAHRDGADPEAARQVLARLKDWKARHDADRAAQAVPFLKMVWDGIFADDDGAVTEAIAEIEAALAAR